MMPDCSTHVAWRLIDTGPLDGAANMAIDEALLECFDPASSAPVLRFYGWTPPALSLGRYQDAAAVLNLERCAGEGIEVVRRITGGGVIYHAEELTYSIVCTPRHCEAGTVKASFARLCSFLIATYGKLGVEARFAVEHPSCDTRFGQRTPFCFAGKEEYDIVIGSRKLGGNAQRRTRGLIFQHGSIPLRSVVTSALPFLREKVTGLELSTVSLAELGVTAGDIALKRILAHSFAERMGVILRPDGLTAAERGAAEQLEASKYRNRSWNLTGVQG